MAKGYTAGLVEDMLDNMLGNAFAEPLAIPTVYIGLSTADPGGDGSGFVEPVGNGYARVAVPNDDSEWPPAASGVKTNGENVVFPIATGAWGIVTHFGIFVAASGGLPAAWGPLDVSKDVVLDDTMRLAASAISVTITNQ